MSTTVDSRVVEMRFDNRHFEQNVSATMSTLDKLKRKLNFTGATKGMEDVSNAAKKVDMNGLANGVETVRMKFSALQVMGVTALANITNSAVNAGKRIMSALTIDPIKTGFQEYETQINAVQTILANTSSKGTTIDDVNRALEELNKYADMTIYNFTEMTRNIGTFTAAGIDLETSVNAIQGIANLAAVSGSNSQQASTAMYQLSQALAAGTVKLMDWNSVVNAGMGGQVFQDALKETSELIGTGAEAAIKAEGSFRESLTTGWLTAEVLTETLKKFTTSGANEYVAEYTDLSVEAVEAALKTAEATYGEADAIKYASEALAEKSGKNAKEIAEMLTFAKTATDAATKVKTFTQLWDVLKESAQSGWSQTWKILIGDFEEAKNLLTPLADFLTGLIGKMSDARNAVLESALGKGFTKMVEGLDSLLGPAKAAAETVDKITESLGDLDKIVNDVIGGKYGNGADRVNALTEAGLNYYKVQNKVNEALGNGFRHSQKKIDAQEKLLGSQKQINDATGKETKETVKLTEQNKKRLTLLCAMTEEQLRSKGYTEDQIETLKELGATAEKLGMPMNEFIDNLDQITGRWLLINSFKNVGLALVDVGKAIAAAWKDIFPSTTEQKAESLFNTIAGLHRITSKFKRYIGDNVDQLARTFQGLFAAIDIVATVVGGSLKIAFKALSQFLGMFDMNILDLTAIVGDAIVKFRDWIDATLDFTAIFEWMIPYITAATQAVKDWYAALKESGVLDQVAQSLRDSAEAVKQWFIELKNSELAQNLIDGLVNGLTEGASRLWQAAIDLGNKLLEIVKGILGIHSPSTEFHEIGVNSMEGFTNGLTEGAAKVWAWLKEFGANLLEYAKNLDPGQIFAGTVVATSLVLFKKMIDVVNAVIKPLAGLNTMFEKAGGMLESIGETFKNVGSSISTAVESVGTAISKKIKAEAFEKRSRALLNLAISIGILAASMFVLSKISKDDMIKAGIALGALMGAIVILLAITSLLNKGGELTLKTTTILGIAASLVVIAIAMRKMADIDLAKLPTAMIAMATAVWSLLMLVGGFDKFTSPKNEASILKMGGILMKLSVALLLMVAVIKLAGQLNGGEILRGAAVVTLVGVLFAAMIAVSKLAGEHATKAGAMLLLMSVAFLTMNKVIKTAAKLERGEVRRGIEVIAMVGTLFVAIIAVSKLAGQNSHKVGLMLTGMATAMFLMVAVIKIISCIDPSEIDKGIEVIAKISLIFAGIIAVSKLAGQNAVKAGTMLLLMSGALLILTGVIFVLSKLDPAGLDRAVEAIAKLGVVFAGLIAVTKLAQDVKGTLLMLTIAVGALSLALITLSFIDGSKLAGATAAISTAMVAFGIMIGVTKFARSTKQMNRILIEMMIAVGLLAVIIIALSFMDPQAVLGSTIALSTLMLSFAGTLAIISKASVLTKGIVKPLFTMLTVVALLASILAGLSLLPNPDSLLPTAVALSTLLLALSTACLILVPVGKAGLAALEGAGILATVILALVTVGAAVGALMSQVPPEKVEEWKGGIKAFMELLSVIAYGLGDAIGSFIGGFAEGALSGLPEIGNHLSGFMTNAKVFIDGASNIDDSFIDGVRSLAKGIMALTVADMMNGIANFDGTTMAQLGSDLSAFMENAKPFIDSAKTLDASMTEGVKNLAEAILILTGTSLIDSLTSWITGGTSLADFGKELESFGPSMKAYAQAVSGIDVEAVKVSAEAAKNLADMASVLPNEGGLLGKIMGENSMDTFGTQLVSFGTSLKSYGLAVTGIDTKPIYASVEATKALAGMAESVPNFGGVVAFFTGDNDLATFGHQLVSYGNSLKAYALSVTGLTLEPIDISVLATRSLAGMAELVPNMGGVVSFFAGDNDLITFGEQLVSFGGALKSYGIAVTGLDTESIANSVTAARSLANLAKILPSDGGFWSIFKDDTISMSDFAGQIVPFGNGMKAYSNAVAGTNIGAMLNAVTAAKYLISLMKNLNGLDTSGVGPFVTAIGTLGTAAVDKFVEAFSIAVPTLTELGGRLILAVATGITNGQSMMMNVVNTVVVLMLDTIVIKQLMFHQAGMTIVTAMAYGIMTGSMRVSMAATSCMNNAIVSICGYYDKFYYAGGHLVSGFCAGITANTFRAEAKAAAMARAALDAANAVLEINSPSKAFYKTGAYAGMGFVNALGDYADTSYKAGIEMASAARSGLSDAIARIGEVIDADVDSQPIISPVLDLTNIQNGANQINGLFSQRSVALAGVNAGLANYNISAIAEQMKTSDSRNSEVVSAISELRSDFGSLIKAIGSMQIRMDSGTVVGELIGKIDSGLGQIATHKGRGN